MMTDPIENATENLCLQVYLAGPDVFYVNPIEIGHIKKSKLAAAGHSGHFPLDNVISEFQADPKTAMRIAKANEKLMRHAQVILVNMTPYHGPSMDVGTAFEAGYMSARADYEPDEILILGYYEGPYDANFANRVIEKVHEGYFQETPRGLVGKDETLLENFGLSENLMIPHAIEKTGGAIFTSFDAAVDNITRLWSAKSTTLMHQQ